MSDSTGDSINGQPSYIQRWIKLAPTPPQRGANLYDVFISYRSSDRPWAMALYDALKLAVWEPFLDQFELVPGANLQTSLEESLQASSSGVILWSSRTKDSDWCKRERDRLYRLELRLELFNILNTPHFANPNADEGTMSNFGEITSQIGNPRIAQIAGKFYF